MKTLRIAFFAVWLTACSLFTPKNERTALDAVQTACVIANASSSDATIAQLCGIADALLPVFRDLLAEQRAQLARQKSLKVGGVFTSGGAAGPPDPVDLASNHVTGVLPAAKGGTATNTIWYSNVDVATRFGIATGAGYSGYPFGTWYQFLASATVTGVRFNCSGASQTYTVHMWSAAAPAASATDLGSCTTAAFTSGVHSCTFSSPITISDLTKSYAASVYGNLHTHECNVASVNNTYNYRSPCVTANGPCLIGPNLRVLSNLYIGTINTDSAPTSAGGDSQLAAVEPVFTVP